MHFSGLSEGVLLPAEYDHHVFIPSKKGVVVA
jgi:hypothetical protein